MYLLVSVQCRSATRFLTLRVPIMANDLTRERFCGTPAGIRRGELKPTEALENHESREAVARLRSARRRRRPAEWGGAGMDTSRTRSAEEISAAARRWRDLSVNTRL